MTEFQFHIPSFGSTLSAVDLTMIWSFVLFPVAITATAQSKNRDSNKVIDTILSSLALTLLWLCIAFGISNLFGLIFLFWLEIETGFWLIWQFPYFLSIHVVWDVIPICILVGVVSALIFRKRLDSGPEIWRAFFKCVTCWMANVMLLLIM